MTPIREIREVLVHQLSVGGFSGREGGVSGTGCVKARCHGEDCSICCGISGESRRSGGQEVETEVEGSWQTNGA
jgi:hypothetical protein